MRDVSDDMRKNAKINFEAETMWIDKVKILSKKKMKKNTKIGVDQNELEFRQSLI